MPTIYPVYIHYGPIIYPLYTNLSGIINITSAGAVDREFVIYFGVRCRTLSPICCRCGVLGFPFAPLELPGAPFGSLWVTLGLPLVPFGSPSGSLWFPLGHPWAPFGSLWATLGPPLAPKARICRQRRLEGILGEAWTSKWSKLMEGLSNIDISEFRSGVRNSSGASGASAKVSQNPHSEPPFHTRRRPG